MYVYPTLFPQSSNREDLVRTVSIFDDDTGQPVNLSGIVLLQNPNGFTGTNWQITDGAIVTSSTTQIFVPGYPVGGQLTALMLQVGVGLAINPGDPLTIADAVGNATMLGRATTYTAATGILTAQVGMQFALEIRSEQQSDRGNFGHDYSPYYDWGGGSPSGSRPLIQATLGNGLTIIDAGYLQINIPVTLMQQLRLRSYLIAMAMTDSINTRQIFIGKLPILYGGISVISQTTQTMPAPTGGVPSNVFTTESGLTFYVTEN